MSVFGSHLGIIPSTPCSEQQRTGETPSQWGKTPTVFGSQTPMVGSTTPSYGSMTPMHKCSKPFVSVANSTAQT